MNILMRNASVSKLNKKNESVKNYYPHVLFLNDIATSYQVREAKNFIDRARGLLFFTKLHINQALWIRRCSSIHTFGMSYPIDVLFLDEHGKVLRVANDVKPFMFCICFRSFSVLELSAGGAKKLGISLGNSIRINHSINIDDLYKS